MGEVFLLEMGALHLHLFFLEGQVIRDRFKKIKIKGETVWQKALQDLFKLSNDAWTLMENGAIQFLDIA